MLMNDVDMYNTGISGLTQFRLREFQVDAIGEDQIISVIICVKPKLGLWHWSLEGLLMVWRWWSIFIYFYLFIQNVITLIKFYDDDSDDEFKCLNALHRTGDTEF
jgi:hypothetical protein